MPQDAQQRLADARVHVIGLGALGCPAADLLVRAGVGEVRLIDRDVVELANLHRQTLFVEADVGRAKVEAAAQRLAEANSECTLEALPGDLSPQSIDRLFPDLDSCRDLLLDCTDNFETRYLLNDLAVSSGVPLIYAGVVGTHGMVLGIKPGATPCLRCVYPDIPAPGSQPTCETAGVLGPASAAIASLQASQAVRMLMGDIQAGSLMSLDVWSLESRKIELENRDQNCPCCVERHFPFLSGRESTEARVLCERDAVHVDPARDMDLDLTSLQSRLSSSGTFEVSGMVIRGQTDDGLGVTVFSDGRAIFEGITEPDRARVLYARLIGS